MLSRGYLLRMKPLALTKFREDTGRSGRAFVAWLASPPRYVYIDSGQLSRWEHGKRFPRPEIVKAVAKATGLKVEDLAPQGEE